MKIRCMNDESSKFMLLGICHIEDTTRYNLIL